MRTFITAACSFMSFALWAQVIHPYSVELRVKEMLLKMSVDEKVGQLRSSYAANPKINGLIFEQETRMDSLFGKGIAMINPDFENTLEESIEYRNKTQKYLKGKTRLGIPAIFLDEAHHGLMAMQTDIFPTSIGLACSWDTALTERIYQYAGTMARSRGTRMVLAPVIDVTRDPRWGRTGETFGEDPFLCGVMGSAVVRGFHSAGVAATLKHFTGHGESSGGVNQAPADFSERILRSFHMEPFRIVIQRSNPAAIMPAYIESDGIPAHANSWLLKDVLRKEWNFKGIIVSDWWAIDQLHKKHLVAKDINESALKAFNAGVTVDLPNGTNYERLVALVEAGKIPMAELDSAVAYVLRLKFEMGLFDDKSEISLAEAQKHINQPEGRKLALEAAEKSMVLLKNQNNLLPIKKDKYKKIAVVGQMAATNYTGDYSGVAVHNVSLLQGLKNKLGNSAEILYSKGVDLSLNGDTTSLNNFQYTKRVVFPKWEDQKRKIDSAVAVALQSDIVICAVGESEQFSREAFALDHPGDQATLELMSNQNELLAALFSTGKPVIVYLAHGRPLIINQVAEKANAIIDGWFTGEECGNAFANILFGDVNPSGKLTISIPRSTGQIPIYYNRKPSQHFFEYVNEQNTPLYPFGYGMSYTNYSYSALRLRENIVSVDVTNKGEMNGDEIVQLYIHQKVSSATRPVKELKDFQRISLKAGETKTVSFVINETKLAYWNADMKYGVEPGVFEIMVGKNSNDLQRINYNYQVNN